jgi:hydroxyacylglutathione hydrolase
VIDTRPWPQFREAHIDGALFAPAGKMFHSAAGSYVEPGGDIVLVAEEASVDAIVRDLVRIGLDDVTRYVTPEDFAEWAGRGGKTTSTPELSSTDLAARMREGDLFVLDVRRAVEHAGGAVPSALNIVHTRLPAHLDKLPRGKPIVVHCQSGFRSAMACAFLARAGYDVSNLAGGYAAWKASGA